LLTWINQFRAGDLMPIRMGAKAARGLEGRG
jgi:hypothetical protein